MAASARASSSRVLTPSASSACPTAAEFAAFPPPRRRRRQVRQVELAAGGRGEARQAVPKPFGVEEVGADVHFVQREGFGVRAALLRDGLNAPAGGADDAPEAVRADAGSRQNGHRGIAARVDGAKARQGFALDERHVAVKGENRAALARRLPRLQKGVSGAEALVLDGVGATLAERRAQSGGIFGNDGYHLGRARRARRLRRRRRHRLAADGMQRLRQARAHPLPLAGG